MSHIDGQPIGKLTLTWPRYGAWDADVTLTQGAAPTVGATVSLVIGDLELTGGVLRSGLDAPGKPRAVVVGAPGWARSVSPALSYQSDAEVLLSTVLRDLSTRAAQPIEQPTDRTLEAHFGAVAARSAEGARLRDVLAALHRGGYVAPWRVDADGVTRFGARVGTAATGRATQMSARSDVGMSLYGLDAPSQYVPGNTVDGRVVERLVVHETAGKLVAEVWQDAAPSALGSILRAVVSAFPALAYGYPRTYVVAAVRGDSRLDLVPPPDAPHLQELAAVEQWNLGGALVTPPVGAEVCVVFRDANPARPIVAVWGTTPGELVEFTGGSEAVAVGADVGRVVRYGDTIMFPSGAAAIPTALPILGSAPGATVVPLPPVSVAKVSA